MSWSSLCSLDHKDFLFVSFKKFCSVTFILIAVIPFELTYLEDSVI